jgi:hypothetical protein
MAFFYGNRNGLTFKEDQIIEKSNTHRLECFRKGIVLRTILTYLKIEKEEKNKFE